MAGATSIKQCGTVREAVVDEREKLAGKDKGKEADMSALEKTFIVNNRVQQSFFLKLVTLKMDWKIAPGPLLFTYVVKLVKT